MADRALIVARAAERIVAYRDHHRAQLRAAKKLKGGDKHRARARNVFRGPTADDVIAEFTTDSKLACQLLQEANALVKEVEDA